MKHFIYTYSENTRGMYVKKTVNIYRIVKNIPVFVITLTDSFVSEFQLVMQALEKTKELPKRAYERSKINGSSKYCAAYLLKDAGIATITKV